MIVRITNVVEASKAYNSSPKGKRADRIWILWDELSLEQVRRARNREELNRVFLSSPPGGRAEKEAIVIFLKIKERSGLNDSFA